MPQLCGLDFRIFPRIFWGREISLGGRIWGRLSNQGGGIGGEKILGGSPEKHLGESGPFFFKRRFVRVLKVGPPIMGEKTS